MKCSAESITDVNKIIMKINIQSTSFHPSEKLIDFTNDKVQKLSQYSTRIMEARVVLKVDKSDDRSNKVCDIRLSIPGDDLFASRHAASFEEAVLETVEVMTHQLVKWKEKMEQNS